MKTVNEPTHSKEDEPRNPWRIVVYGLCALALMLWAVGGTVQAWLPWATSGVNTGALDGMVYTAGVLGAALCWLLAMAVVLWQRKRLKQEVRWAPLWLLVLVLGSKWLMDEQSGQDQRRSDQAAVAGDRVEGYPRAESQVKDKVIYLYFMDFPGPPPDDEKLLKPISRNIIGSRFVSADFGGGGEATTSAKGFYSLNKPKRLRWYIWHIKKHGQMIKDKEGVERFDKTLLLDPGIPVVVCEATVPVYVSPLLDQMDAEWKAKGYGDADQNWRTGLVNLVATFYDDGRTFTLTAPWGYNPKQQPEYADDILQHQHQGECQ